MCPGRLKLRYHEHLTQGYCSTYNTFGFIKGGIFDGELASYTIYLREDACGIPLSRAEPIIACENVFGTADGFPWPENVTVALAPVLGKVISPGSIRKHPHIFCGRGQSSFVKDVLGRRLDGLYEDLKRVFLLRLSLLLTPPTLPAFLV